MFVNSGSKLTQNNFILMSHHYKESGKRSFDEASHHDESSPDSDYDSNESKHYSSSEDSMTQLNETSREDLNHPLKKLQKENCIFTFENINPRDYVTDPSHILVDQSNDFINQPIGERVGTLLMQLLNGFKNVACIHANMNTEIIKYLLNQGKLNHRDIFPLLESYYDAISSLIPLPAEMLSSSLIEPSFGTKLTEHRHISENLIMLQNMWNQIQASNRQSSLSASLPLSLPTRLSIPSPVHVESPNPKEKTVHMSNEQISPNPSNPPPSHQIVPNNTLQEDSNGMKRTSQAITKTKPNKTNR